MEVDAAKEIINYAKRPNAIRLGPLGGDFVNLRIYTVASVDMPSVATTVAGIIPVIAAVGVALGDIVIGMAATTAVTAGAAFCGQIVVADQVQGAFINGTAGTYDPAALIFNIAVLDLA